VNRRGVPVAHHDSLYQKYAAACFFKTHSLARGLHFALHDRPPPPVHSATGRDRELTSANGGAPPRCRRAGAPRRNIRSRQSRLVCSYSRPGPSAPPSAARLHSSTSALKISPVRFANFTAFAIDTPPLSDNLRGVSLLSGQPVKSA
jgi:hypothetical protein